MYMESTQDIARGVIDDLVSRKNNCYDIHSFEKIGELSQNLKLYYAYSFANYIQNLNSNGKKFIQEFAKLHNCATKYGYRGLSKGKKNGIVNINFSNKQLLIDLERMLTKEVIEEYCLDTENLQPIKVVAHVPNGNRLIGVLDKSKRGNYHAVVILGLSNYNGKPR